VGQFSLFLFQYTPHFLYFIIKPNKRKFYTPHESLNAIDADTLIKLDIFFVTFTTYAQLINELPIYLYIFFSPHNGIKYHNTIHKH